MVELPLALVKAAAQRELLLVVGTGASIVAVEDSDSAVSWKGLLQNGLEFASNQGLLSEEAVKSAERLLLESYFDQVASLIKDALGGRRGDWLKVAFEELEVSDQGKRLYDAIARVPVAALLTTNYDNLLGSYLERTPMTWTSQLFATALNSPNEFPGAALHVHGCYLEKDSIVLDSVDYERLCRSDSMEALQVAASTRPLLFIGCGPDGLRDPHFSRLWDYLEKVATRQHFALLPESMDLKPMRAESGEHLQFIRYGGDDEDPHADLLMVLEQLAEEASAGTDQLQGFGRVVVEATETIVEEMHIVVPHVRDFETLLQERAAPSGSALEENQRERLYRLLTKETRNADLCVIPTPVSREEAEVFRRASETHTLISLEGGGMLLGSPDEDATTVIDEAAVEVDFLEGRPRIHEPSGSHQARVLRVTSSKSRIANERATLLIGDEPARLIAPPGKWSDAVDTSQRGKRLRELAIPPDADSVLVFDLAITAEMAVSIRHARARDVIYGLSQQRYAGLRRVIEGQAPLTAEAKAELLGMLAPLGESVFPQLRRDLAESDPCSEECRLDHVAAQTELRSAPEAVYEALTQEDEPPQEILYALLPQVRRIFRRPVDDGTALTTQTGDQRRLLLAASLGDFNLERARTSFSRQRTLLGVVADQNLRLTYTLRSREAESSSSPPERQFLIHCFAKDDAGAGLVARQSVAAAVQSAFHGAYYISYSSAVEEDLEDVQIAAGKADGYARRWVIPNAPSTSWPVSDHGFITDYIRTLPGDIAVTWECHGDDGTIEAPSEPPKPHPVGGEDSPFDELKRLAFDPAYGSGAVALRCCISVRGVDGSDGEVAEEVASLVGNEVFGASAFEVSSSESEECAPISAGHALLAMHAPFGRLYATSYDAPRRFVRSLMNQNFSEGVPIGTGQRKGVERDYPETVTLSDQERFHHVHVVGRPGVGKTTLLKRMILGDLEVGNGVTVVDPHGGLADWTISHIPSNRLKDVILVDLDLPSHAATLNLLDSDLVSADDYDRVISEVIHFMRERSYHEWSGPVFEQLVRLGLLSMRDPAYPVTPAITELVLLLANEKVRNALGAQVEDDELKDGWKLQKAQTPQRYAEILQYVTSKFDELTRDPTLRAALGAPHTTLDIAGAVREGKVLIFRLASTRISEQAADFIGALLLTALQRELLDLSSSRDRPPHFVYVDEFHRFATLGLERLVVEARKFKVGMTLAHQNLDQLSAFHAHTGHVTDQVPSTLVGNAGTLVVFPVSSYDRERLARELGCSAGEIGELAQFQALARIAVGTSSILPFTIEIEDMGEADANERMVEVGRLMRERGIWVPIPQVLDDVKERQAALRRWAHSNSPDLARRSRISSPSSKPPSRTSAKPPTSPSATSSFLDQWEKRREEARRGGAGNELDQDALEGDRDDVEVDKNTG